MRSGNSPAAGSHDDATATGKSGKESRTGNRDGNAGGARHGAGGGRSGGGSGSGSGGDRRNVGDALRAVYREAVDESIPDELLDLLKKLD
ncbi:NepR family anti-sigma factor [Sphingomonas baiyangensis]|uniref:Anti-sigma factor NepR domain-containing protein n=1 Tax=Sphingomonas baiyangensis TaxID=2572576 RepID=A0A4U1L4E3_9SPHN|nr:NepR family anti-sigma factor [Sphingomonas baiyangensis]TKD51374.1 hypothetical protein FBR43_11885 [Sphingomonas baiyangensis]